MEAPEGRGRITPLPPPEPDGFGRPIERAPRQWLPAVLGIAGLVVFALWLAGSGNTSGGEATAADPNRATLAPLAADDPGSPPATPPPTTTTTRPPVLGDILPWLEGSLMLVSSTSDGDNLLVWDAASAEPLEFRLSGANIENFKPEPGSLDRVAYETTGDTRALFHGGWRGQEPLFVGSNGFGWDPAGTGTLMWVGTDQVTLETALYRKHPRSPVELVTSLPADIRLVEWTDFGLIMEEPQGPAVNLVDVDTGELAVVHPTLTVLRDLEGTALATAAAEPLRATIRGTIVAVGTERAFAPSNSELDAEWLTPPADVVILDPPVNPGAGFSLRLVPIREVLADGEPVFSADGRWSVSSDGGWVGRRVARGDAVTLVMRRIDANSVRVFPIQNDGPKTTVGFSQDGMWFFVWSPDSRELIAASRSGAQFAIPMDANIRFGGAFIRPNS